MLSFDSNWVFSPNTLIVSLHTSLNELIRPLRRDRSASSRLEIAQTGKEVGSIVICAIVVEGNQLVDVLTQTELAPLLEREWGMDGTVVADVIARRQLQRSVSPSSFTSDVAPARSAMTPTHAALPTSDATSLSQMIGAFGQYLMRLEAQIAHLESHNQALINTQEVELEAQVEVKALELQTELLERQRLEAILRDSEQRYASLAEAAPVGIFRTDVTGKCVYVNERWCQIAGLSPEQSKGSGWVSSIHPNDRARVVAAWQRSIEEEVLFQQEYRFQRPDGQVTWVVGLAGAESDTQGRTLGYVGSITDITERKQIEQALKASEDRLNEAQQIAHIGSWEFDFETQTFLLGSDETYRIFEIDPHSQAINQVFLETLHSDERTSLYQNLHHTAQERRSFEEVHRLQMPDGRIKYVYSRAQFSYDKAGRPIRALGTTQDISAQQQAELERLQTAQQLEQLNAELEQRVANRTAQLQANELQLSELSTRLSLALKSGAIGYWDWDIASDHQTWDDLTYALFGVEPQQNTIHFETWIHCIHPDDRSKVKVEVHQALTGERDYDTEFRVIHPDQSVHVVKAYGLVQRDEQGNPQRMIGINLDISDRKQYEVQLQQTNAELAHATRLKDEFLANMSHELRTPLNAILGMADGLQEGAFGELNARQLKAVTTIESSGQHLLALINDILDLSKVESGKLDLDFVEVPIQHLCHTSLSFIKQAAFKKGIQLSCQIPVSLNALKIRVDELRIRQVLLNLLNNAVKFTPEGGSVLLSVRLEEADESALPSPNTDMAVLPYLSFSVQDTGIGISPDSLPQIFQAFVQIDSSLSRQYTGSGLGLTLVKKFVELHQGTVSVTSEVGQGSCFTIRIPYRSDSLNRVDASAHSPSLSPDESLTVQPTQEREDAVNLGLPLAESLRGSLILLAENNLANIETIQDYLETRGCQLLVAHNGQQALDLLGVNRPDVILMDIQMPVMNGFETIRHIRESQQWSHIPIVALTALAMQGDREKCLNAGANCYLTKPLKMKELVHTIQTFLGVNQ